MMSTDARSRWSAGLLAPFCFLVLAVLPPAFADDDSTVDHFEDAWTTDGFGLSFRWRTEYVDQEPFSKSAFAMPLRMRVNYGTKTWKGWSAFAEYDYVFDFGLDTYDEGGGNTPDRGSYPIIADPAGGDFNQGWIQWKSQSGNQIRGGRQRIIYDNARFIGNVGWRQNEQTYDAVSFERLKLGDFELRAGYIDQVNRIFGNDVPAGQHDMDTWIANAAWKAGDFGKLVGYYYDIDNKTAVNLSNRTWGLRFTGSHKTDSVTWGYTAEYASQGETGANPADYSADYWRFDLSANLGSWTPYIGYESLGGDDRAPGKAFRTPLATLHAFNGWADKFLTTPDAGLEDIFVGARGKVGSWNWNVKYHDFSAESGSESFGKEFDGSIGTKFGSKFGVLFKLARFETDSPSYGDTTKIWAQFTWDVF